MQENKTHAGIACVLSFIFNGLGQLYNGQILKGLIIISVSSLGMFIFILGSILLGMWFLNKISSLIFFSLGIIFMLSGIGVICSIGIYSLYDAYKVGLKQ